jgi:hypothetical protein
MCALQRVRGSEVSMRTFFSLKFVRLGRKAERQQADRFLRISAPLGMYTRQIQTAASYDFPIMLNTREYSHSGNGNKASDAEDEKSHFPLGFDNIFRIFLLFSSMFVFLPGK